MLCPLSYGGGRPRLGPVKPNRVGSPGHAERRCTGTELYYERAGEGEPMLLIQGMSATHLAWGEPFLDGLEPNFD